MTDAAAGDDAFPVRTRQWRAPVEGVETDFAVSGYADWVMLVATQTGTLGTMMQARYARVGHTVHENVNVAKPLHSGVLIDRCNGRPHAVQCQ